MRRFTQLVATRHSLALAAALLVALPASAYAGGYWETHLDHRTDLAASVQKLDISTDAGNIEVLPGDGHEVVIEARVQAKKKHIRKEEVSDVFSDHVEVGTQEGVLTILDGHSGEKHWQVSFVVRVPRALSVQAVSGAGNVTVKQASGNLKLTTGAGNIKLEQPEQVFDHIIATTGAGNARLDVGGLTTKVKASSGTGNVELQLRHTASVGDVKLTTGVGNVILQIPEGLGGEFNASTGIGSVSLSKKLGIKVRRHILGATAKGTVGSGGPLYKLSTGTGNVKVKVRG